MITLLLSAWACIAWLDPVVETVTLHEWGVIEVDEACLELNGVHGGYVDSNGYLQEYPEASVRAPVIWFHGYLCSGTLSVEIYNSSFTTLIPYPDSIAYSSVPELDGSNTYTAVWEGLETEAAEIVSIEAQRGLLADRRRYGLDSFQRAVPLWRSVPCNGVYYPAADHRDLFIYYESDLHSTDMFVGEYYNYQGEALYFYSEDGDMVCVVADIPFAVDYGGTKLTDEDIEMTINGWCPDLLSEEIHALWMTWKSLVRTRCVQEGETLLLFPLTHEQTESVSSIRFVPDEGFIDVQYHRLFLGLGAI